MSCTTDKNVQKGFAPILQGLRTDVLIFLLNMKGISVVDKQIGATRAKIFKQNIESRGGTVVPCSRDQLPKVTHIIAATYLHALKAFSCERIPAGVFVVEANWLTDSCTNAKKMDERIYVLEPETICKESPTKKPRQEGSFSLSESPASQDTTLKDLNYIENELSPQKPSSFLPKFGSETFDVPRAEIPQCYHKKPAVLRKVAKDGENKNKLFYCCNQTYPQKRCRFFMWFVEISPPKSQNQVPDITVSGSSTPTKVQSWLHYSSDEDSPDAALSPVKLEHEFEVDEMQISPQKPCKSDFLVVNQFHEPTLSPTRSPDASPAHSSSYSVNNNNNTQNSEEMNFTQSSIDVFIMRKLSERPSSSSEDSSQEVEDFIPVPNSVSSPARLPESKIQRMKQGFACQKGPQEIKNQDAKNLNKEITDILQLLESKSSARGDHWRSYAYRKAVQAIKFYPKKLESIDEARNIRGVGGRIADKIAEIISTGKLRQAEFVSNDETSKAVDELSKIWGVGPATVNKWVAMGYRTLKDLKPDDLNAQQKIGLKYYYEFQARIPRKEVEQLEAVVRETALKIDENAEVVTCGSYRRGKTDCGDIDIIITNKKGKRTDRLFGTLIDQLHELNFLTDDLSNSKTDASYMGVCCLPGGVHRRIDIRAYPLEEWPCALLYFTGSGHFNRSMRLWARKIGYQLSDHSISPRYADEVVGNPIPVKTEEDIFKILGIDYKTPSERDI